MRKRLTQVFPWLIPLRKKQRNMCFYYKLNRMKNLAKVQMNDYFKNEICQVKEKIINENSGYDIKYQFNKKDNIVKSSKAFNGILIYPNEVFSFWYLFHRTLSLDELEEGLVLTDGKIVASKGGGLCQLSNLLFKAFLMSPLTIVERKGHDVEHISPVNENELLGIDATIAQGWLDLKVRNDTDSIIQIQIEVDDDLTVSLLSDTPSLHVYGIMNDNLKCYEKDGNYHQEVDVIRVVDGKKEVLYRNHCLIGYEVK